MSNTTTFLLTIALGLTTLSAHAQEGARQPLFSEKVVVDDALDAYETAQQMHRADKDARQEAGVAMMMADGNLDNFVPPDPILYDITWTFGDCVDPVSMIPPPLEGWGIPNDSYAFAGPGTAENIWLNYATFADDVDVATADRPAADQTVRIMASRSPDQAMMLEMMLSNDALREQMLRPGPYDYPVSKIDGGVVLGDVLVTVSGTDEAVVARYLEMVIGCAIASGTIAQAVDPATLRAQP